MLNRRLRHRSALVALILVFGAAGYADAAVTLNRLAYPLDSAVSQIAIGDLNGDGLPDLVFANQSVPGQPAPAPKVSVMLGLADGTFGPATSYPVPGFVMSLAIGDVNGDGNRDVLALVSGTLYALFGDGMGNLGPTTTIVYRADATKVSIADFIGRDNPLGLPALIAIASQSGLYDVTVNRTLVQASGFPGAFTDVTVAISGRDTFTAALTGTSVDAFPVLDFNLPGVPRTVLAGDLNHDGVLDLVVVGVDATGQGGVLTTYVSRRDVDQFGQPIGNPRLVTASRQDSSFAPYLSSPALVDADGDGNPDLIGLTYDFTGTQGGLPTFATFLTVMRGDGAGHFLGMERFLTDDTNLSNGTAVGQSAAGRAVIVTSASRLTNGILTFALNVFMPPDAVVTVSAGPGQTLLAGVNGLATAHVVGAVTNPASIALAFSWLDENGLPIAATQVADLSLGVGIHHVTFRATAVTGTAADSLVITVQPLAPALVGPQGIAGPQGVKGDAGSQGLQGAIGPQGTAGPAGLTGADGASGAIGPMGLQGLQGLSGTAGPQGAPGMPGSTGNTGAQGVEGPQGLTGSIGATGSQGPIGANGQPGPAGATGVPGSKGDIGLTGVKGDKGDLGAAGAQGVQGPVGGQGLVGMAGVNGTNGTNGAQGPAGAIGGVGPRGLAGATGATGATGASGATGSQGLNVPAGTTILLPVGTPAPAGYSLIGSTVIPIAAAGDRNREGRALNLRFNVFRKN
jgi:hypothetical protein